MLYIQEIRKNPDGLAFEKKLDLAEELKERNPEILEVQDIVAKGKVQYEDGLYFLDYDLSYTITLTSSRRFEYGKIVNRRFKYFSIGFKFSLCSPKI